MTNRIVTTMFWRMASMRPCMSPRSAFVARCGPNRARQNVACFHASARICNSMPVGPQTDPDPNPVNAEEHDSGRKESKWKGTAFKMFESAMTTFASVAILGLVGYSYTRYYKHLVLQKMEGAFEPGDPILEMAGRAKALPSGESEDGGVDTEHWIRRKEQEIINSIVSGETQRHYHLLIGEKGTGKSSMLIEAMRRIDGEGVAMFDAHADLELFRLRLGKALDFEYHEDNIGSLFSIRGPRDASALLDVERAFLKLEKVALKRRKLKGKPLVLIINSVHLLRDDEDGRDLLELIQQKAEQWAASNLCTVVLNSDDYWVYERLKNYATRLKVLPVRDLNKAAALQALKSYRARFKREDTPIELLEQVYDRVGGRLAFLSKVAQSPDMLSVCDRICQDEKTWFLNKCWILGEEMDDDVMDQQKWASAAMVLAKALVDAEKEMEEVYSPKHGHILPSIPLHKAREIMTRADFIQAYDHDNLFTIDSDAMVRADSVPMQIAFREICSMDGFDQFLEDTLDRISAIESLGRTRELTIKDLWNGGKYHMQVNNYKGALERAVTFHVEPGKKDDDDED